MLVTVNSVQNYSCGGPWVGGHFDLEVVDVYQQPEKAVEHQLVAAPTLVKLSPPPARRMVGDMSDFRRVLAGLGLAAG